MFNLNDGRQTTRCCSIDINGEIVAELFSEGENTCLIQCTSSCLFNELNLSIGDYNPCSKKYVDDAVANGGGGGITGKHPVFKASDKITLN